MWHSFNISVLISALLPVRLRGVGILRFLEMLLAPLQYLKENTLYTMQHDSRVIYLEKVLNEGVDILGYDAANHEATKEIYIGAGDIPDEIYVFQDNELDLPPYIGILQYAPDGDSIWLNTQFEYDAEYCDFTVCVPSALISEEKRIRHLVEYYKMAGKKYKLIWL